MEYANWFDYLNKTGHESPTDFILDSLQAPGTVNTANLSEVLYVVSQSQNTTAKPVLGSPPDGHTHLSASLLLQQYGVNGTLDGAGLQQAFAAIVSCQLQGSFCRLGGHGEVHAPTQVVYVVNSATSASPTTTSAYSAEKQKENIDWLKGLAAAVLFVEALLGVFLPLLRGVRGLQGIFNSWLLSLLNCFAGGVFITFAIMHLLLHVIGAQADSNYTAYFPIGMFFVVLAFHVFFFLQRVVGPLLAPSSAVATAGGAPGGSCCASAVPIPANLNKEGYEKGLNGGTTAADCPCDETAACHTPASQRVWTNWISPSLLLLAMCIHGIFEGLVLGLQDTKVGAVTVLIALVSHKWVESIALSARCLKAGANCWQTGVFLFPFAATAPIGVGIGSALSNINPWVQMVLYAFATGFFIYVGACEVIAEEFAYVSNRSRGFRCALFAASMAGFTLVALLQLIHDGD
ncbi:g9265 [Coccomyxa elongata]